MSDAQRALIAEKRRAYEAQQRSKKNSDVSRAPAVAPSPAQAGEGRGEGALRTDLGNDHDEDIAVTGDGASFPPSATMCHKCSAKAIVLMDGCATCLNCGYSKCG
jgi:hypothetical protein